MIVYVDEWDSLQPVKNYVVPLSWILKITPYMVKLLQAFPKHFVLKNNIFILFMPQL